MPLHEVKPIISQLAQKTKLKLQTVLITRDINGKAGYRTAWKWALSGRLQYVYVSSKELPQLDGCILYSIVVDGVEHEVVNSGVYGLCEGAKEFSVRVMQFKDYYALLM